MQNYGEHGRELITVEVALRLLQILADPSAELERADKPGGVGKARLKALLHNTVFKVGVPAPGCIDTESKCCTKTFCGTVMVGGKLLAGNDSASVR